ncbi:MAG: hypothetical protein OJF60_000310 [Burkholderiaceae bacterium]|jgi:hypothetical protein|nr:MAG: hypothetical protein OJF60_000310 [Burkholderiaceae bacterium]
MNNLNAVIDSRDAAMADPTAVAPRKGSHSSRALAALLLAASVAALIVVADQLVSSWSDDNLFVAWVVMWAVAFAALGLLSSPARRLAGRLVVRLDARSERAAQKRALAHYLEAARQDPRIRADLQYALDAAEWRSEGQPEAAAEIAETRRYIQWFDQYRPMHDWRADSGQSANVGANWWGAYIEPAAQRLDGKVAQEQRTVAESVRAQASKAWQRELQWNEQGEPKQEPGVKAGNKASNANRWRHSLLEGLLHYRVSA